jgi:hypothetical protein
MSHVCALSGCVGAGWCSAKVQITWYSRTNLSGLASRRTITRANIRSSEGLPSVKTWSAFLEMVILASRTIFNLYPCSGTHLEGSDGAVGGFPQVWEERTAFLSAHEILHILKRWVNAHFRLERQHVLRHRQACNTATQHLKYCMCILLQY